jgi:hypothetical protein
MTRFLRFTLVMLAFVAFAWLAAGAQGAGTTQKPPDTATTPAPGATPQELPPDFKAFNDAAKEKDAQKRVGMYEKFIADHPTSPLVPTAKSQIQSSLLAAFRDTRKKYLDGIKARIDEAKTNENLPLHTTYSRYASELMNAGLLEEAEEYARTGLASMDEQKFIALRKQAVERAVVALDKPPAPQPASRGVSFAMEGGVMVARPAPPRPASAAPATRPAPPPMPTEEALRTSFRSERAAMQATLGQVLLKRAKTAEGEKILKEAYAGKPASSTRATIAKVLAESAKKAGNEKDQFEYLTVLALSGRITADEQKDFQALYRKTHAGSLDGLEEMLDERYRRETPKWIEVTPFTRKAAPNQRVVLAEVFAGSG